MSQPPLVQPAVIKHRFLPVKTSRGTILVSSALLPLSDEETARIYPDQPVAAARAESFSPARERPLDQMHVWSVPHSWLNGYLSRNLPFISDEPSAGFRQNSAFDLFSPDDIAISWLGTPYDLDPKTLNADPAAPFYRPIQAHDILLDPSPRPDVQDAKATDHTFTRPR
ncbi:hypothetical protein L249_0526 [Ophiocordyceps polyrhachis-furcata BCC 54312]|uniref:Uncharacterized protein n=1 Tax=Ophiocordyceps polyrhachis-furcata BCC 54312 TaxID=1330021 RepID=A0A367LEA1_9HYPO|nr:hypothetical protein L249_0526 [Ophiocordyceps polyrhachis-furcata BCC 54312]